MSMSRRAIFISYAQSFLWVALYMAVIYGITNIAELVFIDFIHGNPHRTQENAISMMIFYTPIFGVVAIIGSILVFSLPQFFQAILTDISMRIFGDRARFYVLIALPFTAILTWYCYDYLTPSNITGPGTDPDWTPYEHGLTTRRYLMSLAIQAPITLFSFLYLDVGSRRGKGTILLGALALAVVIGGIWGHMRAEDQFRFL
jgi:hypothetical protein